MRLTNSQRFLKLVGNLARNPDLIPAYVKHNLIGKQYPIDLQLPWWSYRAISYVDKIVPNKLIFEYGTGGSTVRFAKKAKAILAVEDNANWGQMVKDRIKQLNTTNVEILNSPFDFHNPINFEHSDYLKAVDKGEFDIIIIDGQDRSFNERIKCFRYVEPRMKPGQYIIVDDFWRYEELKKSNNAKEVKVFESVGPGRMGVTSTAVFAY